jgi:hypothetical protein
MLKELRELIGFVLGSLNDIAELIRTSCLSTSPLQSLGRDRALSLQLSGAVGIVLVGIFISTLTDKALKIDLLPFGVITLIYFTIAAFFVALAIRLFRPRDDGTKTTAENDQAASAAQIDATSYVISFNLIALFLFALLRDVLNFAWQYTGVAWPAAAAVVVAGAVMLVVGRSRDSSKIGLNWPQKSAVTLLLAASFFGYAATLSKYPG